MATVNDLMSDSLRDIIVAGAESSISNDIASDFIYKLNNLMSELAVDFTFTWTTVDDIGDTLVLVNSASVDVTDKALSSLGAVMAERMAPQFGVQADAKAAERGMNVLEKLLITITATSFPNTLPIGSGNYGDSTGNDPFFPGASTT